jgi:hypothetical protein
MSEGALERAAENALGAIIPAASGARARACRGSVSGPPEHVAVVDMDAKCSRTHSGLNRSGRVALWDTDQVTIDSACSR